MNPKNIKKLQKDGYYIITKPDLYYYHGKNHDGIVGTILGILIFTLALMFIA